MQVNKKWITASILILFSWVSCRAQDDEVIKVDTTLVTVNVSVTDPKGRHLPGLQAGDFLLTDQGKRVRPDFLDSQGPASIVFLVDISSSMRVNWPNLRTGLKKFLAKAREGNDYTLIAFNEVPRLVASSVTADQLWLDFKGLKPYGETALYDALLLGLGALDRTPQRHKALVLLSDGEDNCSHAGLALVQQQARAHRATIYPVGILIDQPYQLDGKKLLNQLAAATGGFVLFPAPYQIRDVLEMINADVNNQYSLSYYPLEKEPGWRRVLVSIARDSRRLNLRYQQQYLMR